MAKKRDLLKEIENLDPVDREALIHNLFELYEYRDGTFLPFRLYLRRHVISEFPGIVQTPGVCGGVARVIRTRIPVWTLERMRQLGIPEVELCTPNPGWAIWAELAGRQLTTCDKPAPRNRDGVQSP